MADSQPELRLDIEDGVAELVLNRPNAMNAMTPSLHRKLEDVWGRLANNPEVRAVVLTGAGKAFCAGGDLEAMTEWWTDTEARQREIAAARELLAAIIDFPLPVVAAVNGPAVGLGCSLALACDIVYIAEGAYLADPHVSIGLTAADGGVQLWPMLAGLSRAKEFLLTGDKVTASRAVDMGLAGRVCEPDRLRTDARALATRLAAAPAHAVRSTKQALNLHVRAAVDTVIDFALESEYASFDDPEHQAVVRVMLDRLKRR